MITNQLAIAGIAEAAEFYSIMFWRGVAGLAVILALCGIFRRSRKMAWIAQLVIALAVGLVQPWWDFMSQPKPTDPDAVHWMEQWKILSGVLIAAFLFCTATLVRVMTKTGKTRRL